MVVTGLVLITNLISMGFDDSSSSRTRSSDDRSTRSSRRREHGQEYSSRDRYYDKEYARNYSFLLSHL